MIEWRIVVDSFCLVVAVIALVYSLRIVKKVSSPHLWFLPAAVAFGVAMRIVYLAKDIYYFDIGLVPQLMLGFWLMFGAFLIDLHDYLNRRKEK